MKIFYDRRHLLYIPKKEMDNGKWVENADKPDRIEAIRESLERHFGFSFSEPRDYYSSYLYLVHDHDYVHWLKKKSEGVEPGEEYFPEVFGYDKVFDTGTPITRNSFFAALNAVSVSLNAVDEILTGETVVYALCRPPGHHASSSQAGGYCYFNNAAIAARYFQKYTHGYVAILDLDFHHGNGTQEIFYADSTVLYVSLHGDPKRFYPWMSGYDWEIGEEDGVGYNFNFPLPGETAGTDYLRTLEKALVEIENFDPDLLIVSLGFDTHKEDPIGYFSLEDKDYYLIGKALKDLDFSIVLIQEGGYNPGANMRASRNFFAGLL